MIEGPASVAGGYGAGAAFSALVVDDDDFTRQVAVRILRRLGASRVLEASDGAAALTLVAAETPALDVILCDLRMPGVNGLDTLRQLAEFGVSALVILVSSADIRIMRSASHVAAEFGIGLLRTISKPLTSAKLLGIFDEVRSMAPVRTNTSAALPAAFEVDGEAIRLGLSRNEFVPFYQPKVEIGSKRVVGAEALVRWVRPGLGMLSPAAFLPEVHAAGLIDALTGSVLTQAVAQCSVWRSAGADLSVSVNIHASSLVKRDFVDRATAILAAAHIQPADVTFEITEDGLLNHSSAREVLTRLRLDGFGLSIDDYGTGYSTLQQLLEAPFDELKIDQGFVKSAPSDREAAVALASSVMLARQLGLRIVAEGIETESHWGLVERAGCDVGQGYAIAKPMPGNMIPAWSADWRREAATHAAEYGGRPAVA